MNILSCNVNGIRAFHRKEQLLPLFNAGYDIICLQETKAFLDQLPQEITEIPGYTLVFHAGTVPGYAGTATYIRSELLVSANNTFKFTHFHDEGRVITVELANMYVVNTYFPNGGDRKGQEMLTAKLAFFDDMITYTQELKQTKPVILLGDINICHTEKDIARPKENAHSIGFLPIEREKLDTVLDSGFIDAFRYKHPENSDTYSWWSPRGSARERNVGWRIDVFYIDNRLQEHIQEVNHLTQYSGSDHCPILLKMNSLL